MGVRDQQLNVRLSPEESARLERIEQHYGLNGQYAVRVLLKEKDDALTKPKNTRARDTKQVLDHIEETARVARVHRKGPSTVSLPVPDVLALVAIARAAYDVSRSTHPQFRTELEKALARLTGPR